MVQQYPSVLEKERARLEARGHSVQSTIAQTLADAQRLLKKDPDRSAEIVAEADATVEGFRQEIASLAGRREAYDQARAQHAQELRKAAGTVREVRAYLMQIHARGYVLSVDQELKDPDAELSAAQSILTRGQEVPDYEAVVSHATKAAEQAKQARTSWRRRLSLQQTNEEALVCFQAWLRTECPKLQEAWRSSSKDLTAATPQEVWGPVLEDSEARDRELFEKAPAFVEEALKFNSMDEQTFETAAVVAARLERLKASAVAAYAQPAATLKAFLEAKEHASGLTRDAERAIHSAQSAVNKADAEGEGRNKLNAAQAEVSEAKGLANSSLPNWLAIAAVLVGAVALANAAKRAADDHAGEVEAARRRRRQEEEEEERRRQSSYASSSSWSSGGGGGFGGFGGGSFGGGGASGGW